MGTWIDGKPIYRKVILCSVTLPASKTAGSGGTWTQIASFDDLNIDKVTSRTVYVDASISYGALTDRGSGDASLYLSVSKDKTYLSASNLLLKDMIATGVCIEYTKTTDTATVAIPSATALMDAYEEGVNEA